MDMMQQQPQPEQLPMQQPEQAIPEQGTEQESGGLAIHADKQEKEFRGRLDKEQEDGLNKFLEAGTHLLFDEDTHYQVMKDVEKSKDIGDTLGNGAFGLMDILVQNSKGDKIPGDAAILAGQILLNRVFEFIDETKLVPVTDDDYAKASDIYFARFMNKYSPEYREKMKRYNGGGEQEEPMQEGQPPAMANAGGGILNENRQAGI